MFASPHFNLALLAEQTRRLGGAAVDEYKRESSSSIRSELGGRNWISGRLYEQNGDGPGAGRGHKKAGESIRTSPKGTSFLRKSMST